MTTELNLPDLTAIEKELVKRQGGLYEFVKLAWRYADPAPFADSPHIELVCRHLEAVARDECRRLIVNIPPALGKSLMACVFFPAWVWTWWPECKFAFLSYDSGLVLRDARRTRALIQSDWYQERWPLKLLADSTAVGEYTNDKQGYRLSMTIRAGLTGKHVDIAVVDDAHKPLSFETGDGKKEAELVWDWYKGTLPTRFTDPQKSRKILIGQRLAEDDIVGRVLDDGRNPEKYELLKLPMEFVPEDKCVTKIGEDWRTEPGELLFPDRYSAEVVQELKDIFGSPQLISAQLQQDPIPGKGTIFQPEWFEHTYKKLPEQWQCWLSVDATFQKSETTDKVAIATIYTNGPDMYLADMVNERMGFIETLQALESLIESLPRLAGVLVEEAANGPAIIEYLKAQGIRVIPIKPYGSKESRASASAPVIRSGHFHLPTQGSWLPGFVADMIKFPAGRFDDQVDAITQFIVYQTGHSSNISAGLRALVKHHNILRLVK